MIQNVKLVKEKYNKLHFFNQRMEQHIEKPLPETFQPGTFARNIINAAPLHKM